MDPSRFQHLRQLEIPIRCHEDWDSIDGGERRRFCEKCGHHVNSFEEMSADEAEALLNQPGRVCARVVLSPSRGILTRDGWIPRLAIAGALAFSATGCSSTPANQETKLTAASTSHDENPKTRKESPKVDGQGGNEKASNEPELAKRGDDHYVAFGIPDLPENLKETKGFKTKSKK